MKTIRFQNPNTRESLARRLSDAGLAAGDTVLVHSSLKAVGWIDGGPSQLVRAFQDVLTTAGTLVMPTFSYNIQGWGAGPFHPRWTSSQVGALTDIFRQMPGVLRTAHPSHSFAAWGRRARAITGGRLDYTPLGEGCPLDRVREADGWIFLLGVGQNRNSTIHLAESLARMPYRSIAFTPGQSFEWGIIHDEFTGAPALLRLDEIPGSSEGFDAAERPLRAAGQIRIETIGRARTQVLRSRPMVDAMIRILQEDPELLLHGIPRSLINTRRLEHLRRTSKPERLATR